MSAAWIAVAAQGRVETPPAAGVATRTVTLPASSAPSAPPGLPAPAAPGTPGKVIEIWVDRESAVTSAWLSNGVLFHHKYLKVEKQAGGGDDGAAVEAGAGEESRRRERAKASVAVCVTIAGAELLESAENRGVSDGAVAAAWSVRSVRSMKAGELDAFLERSGVNVRCHGGADSFMLLATGESATIEDGLKGLRLMLSEPVVDEAELARWKERATRQIEERKNSGNDAFEGVIASLFGPQEARARRPQAETIMGISAAEAQGWLDRAVGAGGVEGKAVGMPMEVAIVGDIAVDRAMMLAEVYFASLPARERVTEETFADRRVATRAERPPEVLSLEHWEGNPLVLVGFLGTDIRELADHRALSVAARIFSSRLDRLPPEQNDGDQSFALSMPSSVYPGFGLFLASTQAREGEEAGASENIGKLLDDLMVNGPSPEELRKASEDLSASAARLLTDPVYWARTLSRSAYHGLEPREVGRATAVYREMSPESITGVLRKYRTPERSIKLIVKPGATP